jgi:hypothetical protein
MKDDDYRMPADLMARLRAAPDSVKDLTPERTAEGKARVREAKWQKGLSDVAAFTLAADRLPSSGKYCNLAEKQARAAIIRWRYESAADTMTDAHRSTLDSRLPGWEHVKMLVWEASCEKLQAARTNGDWSATETWPADQDDRSWLSTQYENDLEDQGLNPRQSRLLNEAVPQWLDRPAHVWNKNAYAVAKFRALARRWPDARSTNVNEARLGLWKDNEYPKMLGEAGAVKLTRTVGFGS